jgi:hypothetical protein
MCPLVNPVLGSRSGWERVENALTGMWEKARTGTRGGRKPPRKGRQAAGGHPQNGEDTQGGAGTAGPARQLDATYRLPRFAGPFSAASRLPRSLAHVWRLAAPASYVGMRRATTSMTSPKTGWSPTLYMN